MPCWQWGTKLIFKSLALRVWYNWISPNYSSFGKIIYLSILMASTEVPVFMLKYSLPLFFFLMLLVLYKIIIIVFDRVGVLFNLRELNNCFLIAKWSLINKFLNITGVFAPFQREVKYKYFSILSTKVYLWKKLIKIKNTLPPELLS